MLKVLTKAEEQVMQALWHLHKKAGLKDVVEAMADPKPHSNTVATVLKILHEKGFITIEPIGRINVYAPAVSKEKYSQHSMQNLVQTYFDGSFSNTVSAMIQSKKLSIDDLEALLNQLKHS
ncbi:MAG: BlaI/MecI/CopY family transcriptional regulator [Prevotellaceae bacterium]|jgi:predicted transcriptional regulator|nr:BlaI/MecI/CopY family transcriptional regulator [Prevotellaceae bacterium]